MQVYQGVCDKYWGPMDVLQSIEEMGQVHVPFRLKMKFGFEVCNGMKNFRCSGHFVEILLVQDCTCVSYHDNNVASYFTSRKTHGNTFPT
jgi:hypothetical protein